MFLGFFLFLLLFMFIIEGTKGAKKTGLGEKILVSIIGGLFIPLLASRDVADYYHKKELTEKKNILSNHGYRYTKSISDDEKRVIRSNKASHLLEICGHDEYKIIDKEYEEIHINSHLFEEKTMYVYCRDFSVHRSIASTVNLNNYEFLEKFPEYPSSQAILKFCDLDSAVIANEELDSLEPGEAMFHNRVDAYLYCLIGK